MRPSTLKSPAWPEITSAGRPQPIPQNVSSEMAGGARIFLKREDLAHTGAHKINNALGQALLAKRMGKHRIIAETGAGQHGVATATACALFGLECIVYMGEVDIARQAPNVFRMKLLGAEVRSVSSGSKTLKDAINEAIRDWVTNVRDTFYIFGTAAGMHPYPVIVRDLQSVIGRESRKQMLEHIGRLPNAVIACVGGGSNAIGIFHPFVGDEAVELIGVEAGGHGLDSGLHAATLTAGREGILHGSRSYVIQDEWGQVVETHSISAGLDYPGVGPEHAWYKDIGRAKYVSITDKEALEGFQALCRTEGIIPALESSHAIAYALKDAATRAEGRCNSCQSLGPRRQGSQHRCNRVWSDTLMSTTTISRIDTAFENCRSANRAALIPYITAGYPSLVVAAQLLDALSAGGADLIEIGVPFSDPLADGATVQATSQKALDNGVTLADCLQLVRDFRARGGTIPILLMGYTNPFYQYGLERLARDAAEAGADGFLIPDLPSDESDEFAVPFAAEGLVLVQFLAPTSTERRIVDVTSRASGFIYCVSLVGVTGARTEMSDELPAYIARVRAQTDLPLTIGFGISTPDHVHAAAGLADGVVVASALINHLDRLPLAEQPAAAEKFVRTLVNATSRS